MVKTLAAFASATLIFGLAGCSGSRHEASEKYYLVASNTRLPYWQAARAGLAQAAHKLGVAYDMVGPEAYDPPAEIQAFRDIAATAPSGILVSAADPAGMKTPSTPLSLKASR
jgi:ribose transport system substrate-binding protein